MMPNKDSALKLAIEKAKWLSGLPQRRAVKALSALTEPAFWDYQNRHLVERYRDAVLHVPHYRDDPARYPRQLEDRGHALATVRQLPVLSKEEVKADTESFWRVPALLGTGEHTTGGTTGTPMRVRAGLRDRGFWNAILEDRYQRITGTRTPRILRLSGYLDESTGGGDIFVRIPGTKFAYLSIYSLGPDNRDRIGEILRTFKPQAIHGYASAIHQLALLFEGEPPPMAPNSFVVVTTSETLFPNQREDIERHLSTRVFNEYGSQEGQHLVLECRYKAMHIHPARGIVEILKPERDEPATFGQLGRVVVTGYANRTMPLLRYDLGDSAVSTDYAVGCECGLQWPTIGTVYGRMEDLVRTKDGRRIGLLSHSTLKDVAGIKESQITQTGFEQFTYRIVPQGRNALDRRALEQHVLTELRNRLKSDVQVEFDYVDQIPRTKSGKLRAVVVDMADD